MDFNIFIQGDKDLPWVNGSGINPNRHPITLGCLKKQKKILDIVKSESFVTQSCKAFSKNCENYYFPYHPET